MPVRERKRVPDHRSDRLKGSFLQGHPTHPRNTVTQLVLFLFTVIRQWISVIVIENLQRATLTDDSRHVTGRVHSLQLLKGHCTEVQGASQDPSSGRQQQQKALMQNV